MSQFVDRRHAGRALAFALRAYRGHSELMVLALPRGGVPVAYEVARSLDAPLDVFVVRKLGVPGHEEFAMGALASGGLCLVNDEVVRDLGISTAEIRRTARLESHELARRELAYRGDRPPADVAGKTVVLVDDGLATGSTMRVGVRALRQRGAARIVAAVPIGAPESCAEMSDEADDAICAVTPEPFYAVGQWYEDFTQTSDEEVRELLEAARREYEEPRGAAAAAAT